jgi:hypothetical protein
MSKMEKRALPVPIRVLHASIVIIGVAIRSL